ncbi:MAG: hypothetical protein QQN45_00405 [Nitrosopumilus sp.]
MISKILLCLLSIIILFQAHQVYADEELPIITIDFISGNIIDLDESPQMVRANIKIQNYNPQHGYHFMEVSRVSDGEIIKDTEILPRFLGGSDDSLYGVQILHYIEPGVNETNLIGDYILRVYSEYGPSESVSTFSIIKSSMPVTVIQNAVDESETLEELVIPDEIVTPEEYYDVLKNQLENFCNLTDEEQFDFFSENSDIIDFNEEFVTICEIEDESEREYTLDDSIDGLISELRDDAEKNVEPTKIPSWVHDVFVWYAEESISENEELATLEYLISEGILKVDCN